MANQQRQGQPQGRENGGAAQAASETAQGLGQRLQEGAAHVGERIHDGYDAAREGVAHGYRRAGGAIARHPGQSVLVGFGVGFGLGMLLTVMLSQREPEPWYDRYVPDRLRHLHLPDALASHLPGH